MEFNCTNSTNINASVEEYLQTLQDKSTVTMIPAMTLLLIFACTGLIGNSLVLFVYSRKLRCTPVRMLLMAIASFDLVANVGVSPCEMITMFHFWNFSSPALCKIKAYLNVLSTGGEVFTLLGVAFTRYRKVCTPYGWQVTNRHAKVICGFSAVLATVLSLPYVILFGRRSKPTECHKIKGYECYTDDLFKDTIWPLINNGLFVSLYFLCMVPLIILYCLIGAKARKHNKLNGVYSKGSAMRVGDSFTASKSSLSVEFVDSRKSAARSGATRHPGYLVSDDECSRNCTGNESENESFEIMNTNLPQSSGDNGSMLESPKPRINMATCDESETGQFFATKAKKTNASELHESINQELCGTSDEIGIKEIVKDLKSNKCDSCSESEHSNVSEIIENNVFQIGNCSNSANNRNKNKSLKKKSKHNFNKQKITGAKITTLKSRRIRRNLQRRRSLSHITAMLFTISAVYVIGYFPFLLLTLFKNAFPQYYANLNMVELSLYHLFLRLYYVNSAANPIIYNLCDANFRRECLKLLTYRPNRY